MKIWNSIINLFIDFKIQGRSLRGIKPSKYLLKGINEVTNSSYEVIDFAFKITGLEIDDIMVDVGCGKGRVFNQLLYKGYTQKMIGFEYDVDVANETAKRLKKYINVQIISGDIFDNFPHRATIFYLFNPFNELLTQKFAIEILKCNNLENIRIFYYYPKHGNVFHLSEKFTITRFSCTNYMKTDSMLIRISPQYLQSIATKDLLY